MLLSVFLLAALAAPMAMADEGMVTVQLRWRHQAYVTNEPYYLQERRMPAAIIRPSTYGIHFYGDCVFTSAEEVTDNPKRVKAFLDATLRGWQYAMDHPDEIIDLILAKYPTQKSREHLRYEASVMRDLIQPDMIQIGHMNPGRWRHMAETFAGLGMVPRDFTLAGLTHDPSAGRDITPFLWAVGVSAGVLLAVGVVAVFLARFNRLTLGREERMIELKAEINLLLEKTGQAGNTRSWTRPRSNNPWEPAAGWVNLITCA